MPAYVGELFEIKDLEKRNAIILEKRLDVSEETFIPEVNTNVSVIEIDNNIFDPQKNNELKKKEREARKVRLSSLIKGSVKNKQQKINANLLS